MNFDAAKTPACDRLLNHLENPPSVAAGMDEGESHQLAGVARDDARDFRLGDSVVGGKWGEDRWQVSRRQPIQQVDGVVGQEGGGRLPHPRGLMRLNLRKDRSVGIDQWVGGHWKS